MADIQPVPIPPNPQPFKIPEIPDTKGLFLKAAELVQNKEAAKQKSLNDLSDMILGYAKLKEQSAATKAREETNRILAELKIDESQGKTPRSAAKLDETKAKTDQLRAMAGQYKISQIRSLSDLITKGQTVERGRISGALTNGEQTVDRLIAGLTEEQKQGKTISTDILSSKSLDAVSLGNIITPTQRDILDVSDLIALMRTGQQRGFKELQSIGKFVAPATFNTITDNIQNLRTLKKGIAIFRTELQKGTFSDDDINGILKDLSSKSPQDIFSEMMSKRKTKLESNSGQKSSLTDLLMLLNNRL